MAKAEGRDERIETLERQLRILKSIQGHCLKALPDADPKESGVLTRELREAMLDERRVQSELQRLRRDRKEDGDSPPRKGRGA